MERRDIIDARESRDFFLREIEGAQTFDQVMNVHKHIYGSGFLDERARVNLGPDMYGMFRTNDISGMDRNDVYIGGFDGLNTLSVAEWMDYFSRSDDRQVFRSLMNRYKNILSINVKWSFARRWNAGVEPDWAREAIASIVKERCGARATVSFVDDVCVADRLNRVRVTVEGRAPVVTDMLVIAPRREVSSQTTLLLPEGFEKGARVTARNIRSNSYVNVRTHRKETLEKIGLIERCRMTRRV